MGTRVEDPLDVAALEAGLGQPFGGATSDEALRAGTRVDPVRLDPDDAPDAGGRGGGDSDQRDHLLRREAAHRRLPPHGPACGDSRLGAKRALTLDDLARDLLGEHLHVQRLRADDRLDRFLEQLREARHVHALLGAIEVDGALDLGSHHGLATLVPDADRLRDVRDAGPRQRETDLGRRRLEILGEQVWRPGHPVTLATGVRGLLPSRLPRLPRPADACSRRSRASRRR